MLTYARRCPLTPYCQRLSIALACAAVAIIVLIPERALDPNLLLFVVALHTVSCVRNARQLYFTALFCSVVLIYMQLATWLTEDPRVVDIAVLCWALQAVVVFLLLVVYRPDRPGDVVLCLPDDQYVPLTVVPRSSEGSDVPHWLAYPTDGDIALPDCVLPRVAVGKPTRRPSIVVLSATPDPSGTRWCRRPESATP